MFDQDRPLAQGRPDALLLPGICPTHAGSGSARKIGPSARTGGCRCSGSGRSLTVFSIVQLAAFPVSGPSSVLSDVLIVDLGMRPINRGALTTRANFPERITPSCQPKSPLRRVTR